MPDSPDWTQDINITGSSETVDVSISGQSAVLDTNISSQTATIDMNIKDATIVVPVTRAQSLITGSPFSAVYPSNVTATVSPDSSAHGIGIMWGESVGATEVRVVGVTTGAVYTDYLPPVDISVVVVPISIAADTSYDITVTPASAGTLDVWVTSIDDVVSTGFYSTTPVSGLGDNGSVIASAPDDTWSVSDAVFNPSAGVSVSYGSSGGNPLLVREVVFAACNTGATGTAGIVSVTDGTASGTVIARAVIGTGSAVGDTSMIRFTNLKCTTGQITAGFNFSGTGMGQSVSAHGWGGGAG